MVGAGGLIPTAAAEPGVGKGGAAAAEPGKRASLLPSVSSPGGGGRTPTLRPCWAEKGSALAAPNNKAAESEDVSGLAGCRLVAAGHAGLSGGGAAVVYRDPRWRGS